MLGDTVLAAVARSTYIGIFRWKARGDGHQVGIMSIMITERRTGFSSSGYEKRAKGNWISLNSSAG